MSKGKKDGKKKWFVPSIPFTAKTKFVLILAVWILLFLPVGIVYLMVPQSGSEKLPPVEELENPKSDEATLVYSSDGEVLGTYYLSNRTKVRFDELSPHLINALVSTEDERYFSHAGIDGWALFRAMASGGGKGGGSTITQQLAKMMFHKRPQKKWGRIKQKCAEWKIATELERRYTKEEILAMYFNEFDFLNTAVGVHAAARVYFGCTPDNLKIEQAAMLVGMAKNPNIFNPIKRPERALKRRMVVLKQMQKNDKISLQQYDSLKTLPLGLSFSPETHITGLAPYFREEIKKQVIEIIKTGNFRNEYNEPLNIYRDGLKIYTTIDAKIQQHAEAAVAKHLGENLQKEFNKNIQKFKHPPFANNIGEESRENSIKRSIKYSDRMRNMKKAGYSDVDIEKAFNTPISMTVFSWETKDQIKQVEMTPRDSILYYKGMLRVGLVALEPQTGFVKAWVGGPNFKYFKYDHAIRARRQVGSTIKPFVYAAAVEQNVLSEKAINAACVEFPNVEYCVEHQNGSETKQWCPGGESYDGVMTPVYFALAASMNNITAKIIDMSGGDNTRVVQYFKSMGMLNSTIAPVPALGLGVCDISVMDMTAAHSVFSNFGTYIKPIFIIRIEDKNGKILYEPKPFMKEIINPLAAFEVLKMMKGVAGVKRPSDGKFGGTGARLRSGESYGFNFPMAGKTGTTQGNSDGWFIGHTPDLVTGVWVGAEDRGIRFTSTAQGQGANTSLPIWGYFMKNVYADTKVKINKGDFEPPHKGYPTKIACEQKTDFNSDDDFD